jgi:hypothetical protein
LGWHSGNGAHSAATKWTDAAPAERLEEIAAELLSKACFSAKQGND